MIATHTYKANIQYLYCQLLSVTVTAAWDGPVTEQVVSSIPGALSAEYYYNIKSHVHSA